MSRPEKLSEGERFDPAVVVRQLTEQGRAVRAFPDNAALFERLAADTLPAGPRPRIVAFFSNGSFDGIIARYAAAAQGAEKKV